MDILTVYGHTVMTWIIFGLAPVLFLVSVLTAFLTYSVVPSMKKFMGLTVNELSGYQSRKINDISDPFLTGIGF